MTISLHEWGVQEQFQFLHDKVLDTYRQHSTAPGCLNQVDVRLTTDLLERTAPFRYCNHASSVVHYHDTVADRQSEVLLYLNPAMLDPASYLAIPYLLAHELICHAWQGVDARSADSRNQISSTGPDDSFAEGWMDAVAWYLLEKWAKQSARVPIRDEHLQIGHEVHRERRLVPLVFNSNEMTPAAWNARTRTCEMTRLGAQTALDFAQLLRDHEDGYEADEVWLKLSLNLNLRAGIVDARQGLVSALSSSLVGNNRQTVSRILDAVHNYCRTNDLWLFLKHFLGKTWRGVP